MQEGLGALDGYARIFPEHVALSGEVPQISVITGTSAGGGCYSPALTDFVVMTERREHVPHRSRRRARGHGGGRPRRRALGGPAGARPQRRLPLQRRRRRRRRSSSSAELLAYLPAERVGAACPRRRPPTRPAPDPGGVVPLEAARAPTTCATAIARDRRRRLAARGRARGGRRNIVTALARIEGRPVGIVANQPRAPRRRDRRRRRRRRARASCAPATRSGCRSWCSSTPRASCPAGHRNAGVIRHGAKLLHAFAAATVPRFTVVLRKAFGGAYITMNSQRPRRRPRARLARAELGIMGARAGRRHRAPPRARGRRRARRAARRGSPTPTPPSTSPPPRPPAAAPSTR